MHTAKSLSLILSGVLAGIVLVLACNGDGGGTIDAANGADGGDCPCTPEEPFENRLREFTETDTLQTTDTEKQLDVSCRGGGIAVSGYCKSQSGPAYLRQAGRALPGTWSCTWRNGGAGAPMELTATVVCLMPPGTPDGGM